MADNVILKANALKALLANAYGTVREGSPYVSAMFPNQAAVDAFVAVQTPLYIQALTELEQATDALGTDILN